jgi:hypothetical protein
MSDIKKKKTLSCRDAEQKIQEIAAWGDVVPLPHCCDRMEERNYDMNDLLFVLTRGKVRGTPKYDQKYHNWKCKVEGTVIEGETAIIVVAITGDRELSCITIYDK